MKKLAALLMTIPIVAFSSCGKDPSDQENRLTNEAIEIQYSSLQAILKNDLVLQIDLDEQDAFFAGLRTDLERCREIEAKLRLISPGPKVSELEENTTGILLAITERAERIQRYRDATGQGSNSVTRTTASEGIEGLKGRIESFKEHGLDTEEAEELLGQLEDHKAEQGGAEQPATAPESKPEDSEKPKPQSEVRSQ